MAKKPKEPTYDPQKIYIITAKFEMKGDKVELFLPRLANAKVKWVEEKYIKLGEIE